MSNIHPWHLTLTLPPSFSGSWVTIKGEMKHRNSPDSPLFMFLGCEVTFDFIQFHRNKTLTRKGNEGRHYILVVKLQHNFNCS